MNKSKIWLSPPHIGDIEKKFVEEAFVTNWIAPIGPNVDGFESDIQSYTGVKFVAAVSSGTAAIHLGLIALGIKPGDLVLCQSMTFSATANPIIYLGATPIFIDSEIDTWNMCPIQLEKAIVDAIEGKLDKSFKGKKPKAIIPVHLYGMPAKMDEINAIAAKYNIPVLEDAAEAMGSRYKRKYCGSLGKIGVLSFNGNKIITTSGGGALLSNDELIIKKARFLATQARDQAPHYEHSEIGYNYRMSNVLAGIGRGQMKVLDQRVEKRRDNNRKYREMLGQIDGISFLDEPEDHFSNYWLTTILVDPEKTMGVNCEDIRLSLEKENIESRPLWKPMHLQPVFEGYPFCGTGVSDKLFENGLCLPSGTNMTDADLERINTVLKRLFGLS